MKTLKLRIKDKHASVLGEPAKTCGKCGVLRLFSDFTNCAQRLDGKASTCKVCQYATTKAWRQANPEKSKASTARWVAQNKPQYSIYQNEWRDQRREALSQSSVEYARINKARTNARTAKRRAAEAASTFGSCADIQMWYEVAEVLSRSGVRFQVDHIVPLVSARVCGLHAPWNMTVLPQWQNASKGNRWWPDTSPEAGVAS